MNLISKVQINSSNPCLIVFLVDQSGSMELTYGGNNTIKKEGTPCKLY